LDMVELIRISKSCMCHGGFPLLKWLRRHILLCRFCIYIFVQVKLNMSIVVYLTSMVLTDKCIDFYLWQVVVFRFLPLTCLTWLVQCAPIISSYTFYLENKKKVYWWLLLTVK
jgi:hypothetical protein